MHVIPHLDLLEVGLAVEVRRETLSETGQMGEEDLE
jgi:hypothetical protein